MVPAQRADVALFEQVAGVQVGRRAVRRQQGEVELAAFELRLHQGILDRPRCQPDVRGALPERQQERHHHGPQPIVGGRHGQREARRRRVEGRRLKQRVDFAQHLLDRSGQLQRTLVGIDASCARTKSGSSKLSRSRVSMPLIAGCVIASRAAARVTLHSSSSASSALSRFRSRVLISRMLISWR